MSSSSSSSSATCGKDNKDYVTLKSKDEKCFKVKESIAFKSTKIKNMVKSSCADTSSSSSSNPIYLPKIESGILAMLLDYLNKHEDFSNYDQEKYKSKYCEELAKKPLPQLFDFYTAAVDLEINGLDDLISKAIVENINGIELEGSKNKENDDDDDDIVPQEEDQEDVGRDENYRPWSDFD